MLPIARRMDRVLRFRGVVVAALVSALGLSCAEPDSSFISRGPGSLAADFLTNVRYTSLDIEFDYVAGQIPGDLGRDYTINRIRRMVGKSGEIKLRVSTEIDPRGAGAIYTLDEIKTLEKAHRDFYADGDRAAMYLLFLDGRFEESTDAALVLALAYGPSSMVVFRESVQEICVTLRAVESDPVVREALCPASEAAAILHEFGHLIGLVGKIPMVSDHEDPQHPGHDRSENCIMHWNYTSAPIADFVRAKLVEGDMDLDVFDRACRDDVEALRDRPL
jgi:hypothetical protein